MAKVEASELIQPITDVLMNASTGKGTDRGFLTGYQILKRLSQPLQEQLRAAYGDAGTHGGQPFGAATRVSQVAAAIQGVEQRYLDTRGLQFDVGQSEDVSAGFELCALFRLP
jgi:hypothetical protein